MRLRVRHVTEYDYSEPAVENSNDLRLYPRETRHQRLLSWLIKVLPATRLRSYEDFFLNRVHYFEITKPHNRLLIDSHFEIEVDARIDVLDLPYGFLHSRLPEVTVLDECREFLLNSHFVEMTPEIWREAIDVKADSEDVFETTYAIMEHIYRTYEYVSGATNVSTHANEAFSIRKGVCQDFAHVMLAMCRALRIPARYASGYFFDPYRDHRLRGSEASHAWVEIYLPDLGWIGFDPTNRQVVDDRYVVVAVGRDYLDVAPVHGTFFGGCVGSLDVRVTVEKVQGTTPEVTTEAKPAEA